MRLRWPVEFDAWIRRAQQKSREGNAYYRRQLELVAAALRMLRSLQAPPEEDTAGLRRVAQSRRHQVWRTSHPYEQGIAVRLICWFPPDSDEVVVALFTGEKARIGDVWYDSVGRRADLVIEQWLRELARNEEGDGDG
ncbi:hypothetical protein GCM10027062_25320 [Nocardioides hungaricus]